MRNQQGQAGVPAGTPSVLTLSELVRSYNNLPCSAFGLSPPRAQPSTERAQWLVKLESGARVRAAELLKHLDVLVELRPPAKAAMLAEAHKRSGWNVSIDPVSRSARVAQIMAIMRTPFRFRTKRKRALRSRTTDDASDIASVSSRDC